MWITNLSHYLDDLGDLALDLPNSARNIALFQCSIVGWVTAWGPGQGMTQTNLFCRRSPQHRRCTGEIFAERQPDDAIYWECLECGDRGLISGWQGTAFDRSLALPIA